MTVLDFIAANHLSPGQIDGQACVTDLMERMAQGLKGEGNIPMIPSFLSAATIPPRNQACCVLDAGGTNLRSAKAWFDAQGNCRIENVLKTSMPGTEEPLGFAEFYRQIASLAKQSGCTGRVGLCFSYNVELERTLDGILAAWCKEVKVPEAVGRPVGQSLRECLGEGCSHVHVLNDSVAAMLGAAAQCDAQVGLILGTGVNVCYEEACVRIPKVPSDLRGDKMIINTEVGEYDGIVKSPFDLQLFAQTEDPGIAHAEKQCAGGYLGDLICLVWKGAAKEGILDEAFLKVDVPLSEISNMLAGKETGIPASGEAVVIAETLIHRAAKIAAILCAGPVLRCTEPGNTVNVAVEGSQFHKLTGFRSRFEEELSQLLAPRGIGYRFVFVDNACLKGAALAAFAEKM